MASELPEDVVISRLINAVAMLPSAKSEVPFSCLLTFKNKRLVLECISGYLHKSKDGNVRTALSQVYQDYVLKNAETLHLNDDTFVISQLVQLIAETPATGERELIDKFASFVTAMLANIEKIPVAKTFNLIVKTMSPYAPLAIVLLTKNCPELQPGTIKFVFAMAEDVQPLSITAIIEFIRGKKHEEFTADVKEAFAKSRGLEVIQNAIQVSITQKIEMRLFAVELGKCAVKFCEIQKASRLAVSLMPSLLQQLRESSSQLKTSVVQFLAEIPDASGANLLDSVLSELAAHFEEGNEEYAMAVFEYLEKKKSEESLRQLVLDLIQANETYVSGVCFAGYLGYLDEDIQLVEKLFPKKPDHRQAVAASMALSIMGNFKKFTKLSFQCAFRCLLHILTSSELLDDLLLQFLIFKQAIGNVAKQSGEFPFVVSSLLLEYLPKIKDDEVLTHLVPIVKTVLDKQDQLASVSVNDYAVLYVSLLLRFVEDSKVRSSIMPYLAMLSQAKQFDINQMVCDIVDQTVPVNYVDAVRTEAILKSQHSPRAALIAVALPNCAPFLATLCRVVRELVPEDCELTNYFLKNAAKRALDAFLPHLLRFTDPVETSNSFLFVSLKEKHVFHLREVFACIAFILQELNPTLPQIEQLLDIAERAFPDDLKKIDTVMPEALMATKELANTQTQRWKDTLLKKIFVHPCFASSYHLVLRHCPPDNVLLIMAATSYSQWMTKNTKEEDQNNAVCQEIMKVSPTKETFGIILKAMMRNFEAADDPIVHLKFCLKVSDIYHENSDDVQLELSEFIVALGGFALSQSPNLRELTRDLFYSIFGLKLSVNEESPLMKASQVLSPVETVEFAEDLFLSVFKQFDGEFFVDFSLFVTHCRPFQYLHSLLLHALATLGASSLVATQKSFLAAFFEAADLSVNEGRVLLIDTVRLFCQSDMTLVLQVMLRQKVTPFRTESVKVFLRDQEYRSNFLNSYGEIISSLDFPVTPKEQADFLSSGYFQVLSVIIEADDMLRDTFGPLISYILVWLSLLFSVSGSVKTQKVCADLVQCFELIFSRLSKGAHEPIEFSLRGHHALYQSLGSLVNALLMIDQDLLLDFVRSCSILLNSHLQATVLTASLCLSRLLHRMILFNCPKLLPQLKSSVALSFVVCCDENCRVMSAVMNDLFNRQVLESFDDEEYKKIAQGVMRGVSFPGGDLKKECVAFLCKVIVVSPRSVLEAEKDRLWAMIREQEIAPLTLTAVTALLQVDNSISNLTGQIRLERLLLATVGENVAVARKATNLLEALCEVKGLPSIIKKLHTVLDSGKDFQHLCENVIDKVSKSNISIAIMDLIVMLSAEAATPRVTEKAAALFLLIIEDGDHVLRAQAGERLSSLF